MYCLTIKQYCCLQFAELCQSPWYLAVGKHRFFCSNLNYQYQLIDHTSMGKRSYMCIWGSIKETTADKVQGESKQSEQATRSKSVAAPSMTYFCICSCLRVPVSCPGWLQRGTKMLKCKPSKPFLSSSTCFWSLHFITTIVTPTKSSGQSPGLLRKWSLSGQGMAWKTSVLCRMEAGHSLPSAVRKGIDGFWTLSFR